MIKNSVVENVLKDSSFDYAIFYDKEYEKSYIVLIFPYKQFETASNNDIAIIDPYYLTSNSAYFYTKKIIKKLKNHGLDCCFNNNINYKKFLKSNFNTSSGINTLVYTRNMGSGFYMQIIEVDSLIKEKAFNKTFPLRAMKCSKCYKCYLKCPNDAINKNGTFEKEKCIRYIQENIDEKIRKGDIKRWEFEFIGNKLLGCNICQNVCPYNISKNSRSKLTASYLKLLNLERLIEIADSTSKIKKIFESHIGSNYSRKKYFLPNTIIVAGNSKRPELIPGLKKMQNRVHEKEYKSFIELAIKELTKYK